MEHAVQDASASSRVWLSVGCFSAAIRLWLKKMYQNGKLVYGDKDYLRNPSCLILSHTHFLLPVPSSWHLAWAPSLCGKEELMKQGY